MVGLFSCAVLHSFRFYRAANQSLNALVPQHVNTIDPKMFAFGQSKAQLHSTFGMPDGCNSQHPVQFLRKYEKHPILPDRESISSSKHAICIFTGAG